MVKHIFLNKISKRLGTTEENDFLNYKNNRKIN